MTVGGVEQGSGDRELVTLLEQVPGVAFNGPLVVSFGESRGPRIFSGNCQLHKCLEEKKNKNNNNAGSTRRQKSTFRDDALENYLLEM